MIETPDQLQFSTDRAIRLRYFTDASFQHPAKMHAGLLLHLVERYTTPGQTICDPMYGIGTTGLAALMQRDVIGFEIEPPYLAEAHRNAALIVEAAGLFAGRITIQPHDAREPWPARPDVVLFSPPYGCDASGGISRRRIIPEKIKRLAELPGKQGKRWRHLATRLASGSMASLVFHYGTHPAQLGHLRGQRYWEAMEQVYTQARAALRPHGYMILVIKDHIRKGQRVCVATQTAERCEAMGFRLVERLARTVYPLSLWQRRRKEQGKPIVEEEDVLVFTTGERS